MTWWCSATGVPWTWHWRPYPGVWLFVVLLVVGYVTLYRSRDPGPRRAGWPTWRLVAFAIGAAILWLALDWPLGALGTGYLLSVHTAQYLLITFVTSPLLLLSLPAEAWHRLAQRKPTGWFLRLVARGLPAFAIYNLVLILTHLPAVVDRLMRLQLGSFAADLAWLVGGFALWLPVLAPSSLSPLEPPVKIGYLFVSTILPTAPAAFLTFADYPVYALYELAPRVAGISAHADQQMAGLVMKLGADPIIWLAMAILFFRWSAESESGPGPSRTEQVVR